MRIKLRQVEAFLAAAETGSFSRAAERIGITQPAFSQLIREMENALDVRLFDRTTRRVYISEAGRMLREHMGRGLQEIEQACSDARAMIRLERGKLSLAVLPSLAIGYVTRVLAEYRNTYPGIAIQLHEVHNDVAIERVMTRQADFAMCTDLHVPPGMEFEKLFDDELMAVLPAAHPLAQAKAIQWPELQDEALILISAQSSANSEMVRSAFRQHGLEQQPQCEVMNIVTAMSMARAGLGVAFLSRAALPDLNTEGVSSRPMTDPALKRNIGLCSRHDRNLPPAAERFREMLRRHLELERDS